MARQRKQIGFARWIEAKVQLPVGLAAEPGPIRLPPYMIEIAEALIRFQHLAVSLASCALSSFNSLFGKG
jgi:hypothetical protein